MKAMILAAGYGTRLQALTNTKPKALIEIKGIPLLEIIIKRLIRAGIKDMIINLHHFADQIKEFIQEKKYFGINIQFSEETEQLLDTGGGIYHARWFFDDGNPFLVHNVDVLTDLDIPDLYRYHIENKALVTLAVRDRQTNRKLAFGPDMQLCEWVNTLTGQKKISRLTDTPKQLLAYSCLHIVNPECFNFISEQGAFSIMDVYLRLAKEHAIKGYVHNTGHWFEMGKYEQVVDFNEKHNLDFLL